MRKMKLLPSLKKSFCCGRWTKCDNELGRFVGPQKVVMRDGLEGSVQAIDSDWGFVIVNVAEKDALGKR